MPAPWFFPALPDAVAAAAATTPEPAHTSVRPRSAFVIAVTIVVLGGCRGQPAATPEPPDGGRAATASATALSTSPETGARGTNSPTATGSGVAVPAAPATVAAAAVSPPSGDPTAPSYIGLAASGGAIGQIFALSAIRTGVQPDRRVRIVWEMAESQGTPMFEAVERSNTEDPPLQPVAGAARIEVTLHDVTGFELQTIMPVAVPPGETVTEVRLLPVPDDSILTFAIGLVSPAPFEARLLSNPVRVVIDILPDGP